MSNITPLSAALAKKAKLAETLRNYTDRVIRPSPMRRLGLVAAVRMLTELEDQNASVLCYYDRPDQYNIVLRFLLEPESKNLEWLEGFAAVLSDFIATGVEGGITDIDWYIDGLEQPTGAA